MSWPMVALGEEVEILSGFAFKSKHFNTDGVGLPLVRIRDVKGGKTSTFYEGDFDEKFVVNNGDLLVGMDGEFNCAHWQGGRALLNQRVCKVSVSGNQLDAAYLARFLPQALKAIEARSNFVTVKHLSAKQIREIEIPLPPLDEQKRIAAILDKADALRRAREAQTDFYDDLSVSVFYDLFGDPFLNDRKWDDTVQLGAVSEIASGITKGRKTNGAELVETPYLAVSNVQDRRIDLSVVKTIAATQTERARFKLRPDDLLLTEGGDPDKLGRGALWDGQISDCIHQNHVFRVRFDTAKVVPVFGMWLIGSVRGRRYFLKSAKQTTGIASINKTQLREFPMLCPPIELQKKFAERIARIVLARRRAEDALVKAQSLFASLQHRAFAGEL